MGPKGSQYEPEGCQKGPNMNQRGAKMSPKGAKGQPKVTPEATKIRPKIATSKKVEKGGSGVLSFDSFLVQKRVQKSMRKTMPKKASKIMKFNQKSRYDSIPRNAFSHRLSAKAVPAK